MAKETVAHAKDSVIYSTEGCTDGSYSSSIETTKEGQETP